MEPMVIIFLYTVVLCASALVLLFVTKHKQKKDQEHTIADNTTIV